MDEIALRPATANDAPVVLAWRLEPSTSRFQPTLPLSLAQVEVMLSERAGFVPSSTISGKFQWLIQASGVPVGWITLTISEPDRRHANGMIGYTVGESFRRQGIGSTAIGKLLPLAFGRDAFGLERLAAVTAVENVASRRALERNGFELEGILREMMIIDGERLDHTAYGLLRREWEAR